MLFISILYLIVVFSTPSFKNQIFSTLLTRITTVLFFFTSILSLNVLNIQEIGSGIGIYSGLYNITNISQYMDSFIFMISFLILISWHTIPSSFNAKEYSLIVLFSSFGASLLVSSADLISMYLSIELQSFGVYILSTLFRDSESATSAGLKYFLLGGLSSCIILLGAGIIYSNLGVSSFESIFSLASSLNSSVESFSSPNILNVDALGGMGKSRESIEGMMELSLGLFLIFTGFLLKVAAAPFHFWAPDVYDGTPTIVTIWLQIMPKLSIFTLLIELLILASTGTNLRSLTYFVYNINLDIKGIDINYLIEGQIIYFISNFLILSCILSLIFGSVVGIAQNRIKRLLAYSTISHVGFILIGLSLMTVQSINSLILYLIIYSLTNVLILLSILGLRNTNYSTKGREDLQELDELQNTYKNTILSISLTIGIFSLSGIPPLSGFFSKAYMLQSAVNINLFTCFIAIFTSVISAVYYLRMVMIIHTPKPQPSNTFNSIDIKGQTGYDSRNIKYTLYDQFNSIFSNTVSFATVFTILFPFLFSWIIFSTNIESLFIFSDSTLVLSIPFIIKKNII